MPDEEASPGQKVQQACCLCILGFLVFPASLFWLGNNEKSFVCKQKNILTAENDAVVTACDGTPKDNSFVVLSCPLDTTVGANMFTKYNLKSFGLDSGNTFGDKIAFESLSAEMDAPQMYQCQDHTRTEKVDPNCEPSDASRRRKHTCPTKIVHTYSMGWKAGTTPIAGEDVNQARLQGCPGLVDKNPDYPVGFMPSEQTQGPPKNIKMKGNFYITEATGSTLFKPTTRVSLYEFAEAFPGTALKYKKQNIFDATHVVVVGDYLQNCKTDTLGCVRVSFKKNEDTGATLVASSGVGYKTEGQTMPASWGCGASDYKVFRKGTVAQAGEDKGKSYEGKAGKALLIKEENTGNMNMLYLGRVGGILLAWLAVFCCLYPIVAFFDIMEDYMAMIPCIGPLLSVIGSIVEWLVTIVVCCMSCSFGCSAALFTVAIVWLVMRPLQGALYMGICVVLVGGSCALAHMAPKKDKGSARDLSVELNDPSA